MQIKEDSIETIQPRAEVKLKIVVLDDPDIAKGLKLLRGEWNERTGGQLEILESSSQEFQFNDPTPSDLIIYPSKYLGELVSKGNLRKVSNTLLESEAFDRKDLLPLIRNRVLKFGDDTFGLTIGESPLLFALQQRESNVPTSMSWRELDDLKIRFEVSKEIEYPQAMSFLARAIGYASHPSRTAILFDPDSMQPRINSPPFQRALKEMRANQKLNGNSNVCALTIPQGLSDLMVGQTKVELTGIPRVDEIYNYSRQIWIKNKSESAPTFIGFSGRLISVTRSSKNAASAYKMLEWLSLGDPADSLSQRSKATSWFRGSQLSRAPRWLPKDARNSNAAQKVMQLLSSEDSFMLPRIPAIDQYLSSLENSIPPVLYGDMDTEESLLTISQQWEVITKKQGRDLQREAYRMHLGYTE